MQRGENDDWEGTHELVICIDGALITSLHSPMYPRRKAVQLLGASDSGDTRYCDTKAGLLAMRRCQG